MYIGYYPNVKDKTVKQTKKRNPKIVLVMPVYVGEAARSRYPIIDEEMKPQGELFEDKLDSIKFTLKCHAHFDAGMPYEIVLVDNGTENAGAVEFFKSLNLRYERRENEGFSFGAWQYFWDNNKDYDYYLFTEADYVPCKNGWLKEIYDEFHKKKIGAVGNVLETRGLTTDAPIEIMTIAPESFIAYYLNKAGRKDWMCNFDGCYTFTSREVLEQVDKNGGLLVYGCTGGRSIEQQQMASTNEVCFQQPILNLGYNISAFGHPDFSRCDRIYFYGIRSGNLFREFKPEKLVPIINGNTRNSCDQIKDYFNSLGL